jgi:hypothetical protein
MTTQIFDRGESVPIWAENKNWAGTLTDPTGGIKVTLKDRGGVLAKDYDGSDIDDKAMTKDDVGKYVFYYNSKAATTLASGITVTATSITAATGEGLKLPASDFYIEIDDEILKCTTRTVDVLTVVRGQKGTIATAHSSGASVWRLRGGWSYFCKAIDGSGDTTKTVITYGSFELK